MTIFCLMIPSFCWKYVSKKSFITISSSDTESRLEKRRYKFFHISSDRRNIISIFSIYTCLPEKALFLNSIFTLRVHLAPKHRIYFFPIWWYSFDPAFVWRKKVWTSFCVWESHIIRFSSIWVLHLFGPPSSSESDESMNKEFQCV